ncbi:hypothetical protein AERO_06810 [Aeromicrobium fastidiosum]|uniref:hypothetical protein n=1 Tax=Aeromicrobium fastidiosum TaxID=52699 RepID=UPI0020236128|nr:hypothetical protein [Aeromicrobium fastidiosum]MCL8251088.1 hypothetical protein [Aeromicrobium fastidiosum]
MATTALSRRGTGIRGRSLLAIGTLCLAAACGGGGDGDGDEPSRPAAPAGLTLDDLKPSPDFANRQILDPVGLDLGSESATDLATSLGYSLKEIVTASFLEPAVWSSTSDEDVFRRVYGRYGALGDRAESFADDVYASVRTSADGSDPGRVARLAGSVFPTGAAPAETFVYKLAYDASVDGDTVTLRAVVWAGYDVGGEQPVLVARQLTLTAADQGADVGYGANEPVVAGFYDTCDAVVDGVLTPSDERIDDRQLDALHREFENPDYRPLEEAIQDVVDADGADGDVADRSRDTVARCLADAGAGAD